MQLNEHDHCDNCVKWSNCLSANRSQSFCPIVSCELGCGAHFHVCKSDEHLLLCSEASVACLNASYGCSMLIRRRYLSKHLVQCAASVVHCSFEWNRWPLHSTCRPLDQLTDPPHFRTPSNCDQHSPSTNRKARHKLDARLPISLDAASLKEHQLDVALTLRDQRLIGELQQLDQTLRCLLCNSLTRLNPPLPIKPYVGDKMTSKNRPQSATGTCPSPLTDPSFENICTSLVLDLNFDATAPFQPKPKQMFTFRCAQDFRRDEYHAHYHNVHSDIMGSMSGWMERRCPKWQYGCPAIFTIIHPYPYPSQIVYNNLRESFGHLIGCFDLHRTLDETGCDSDAKSFLSESVKPFPLMQLPPEVLEQIISKLDGFSLNNVSMTCKTLRQIVTRLLNSHGLVCLVWKRIDVHDDTSDPPKYRWKVDRQRWFFSNSMHEIHRWRTMGNDRLLNHLQSCRYGPTAENKDPVYLRGIGSSFYKEVNQNRLDFAFKQS